MRLAPCLLLVALAAACGSAEPGARVERYGISLEVPEGWEGEVSRGLIRIAHGDVSVVLREYEPSSAVEAVYFRDPWPVQLEAGDFGRRADGDEDDAYLTRDSGRLFSVFPGGSAPSSDELAELNDALTTIGVRHGDYYPGTVEGLRFRSRAGWDVGQGGAGERRPQGEFVTAWAATTAYKDGPDAFPRRTLETLPEDGIVIWVMLSRGGPLLPPAREPEQDPPYRLRDLDPRLSWEGQIRDLPEYVLWSRYGDGYLVDLRVYFGRPNPSQAMRAEADAMVAALEFPDWGRWELDSG